MSGDKLNSKVIDLQERKRRLKFKEFKNILRRFFDFFLPDKPDKKGPNNDKKNKFKKPVNH